MNPSCSCSSSSSLVLSTSGSCIASSTKAFSRFTSSTAFAKPWICPKFLMYLETSPPIILQSDVTTMRLFPIGYHVSGGGGSLLASFANPSAASLPCCAISSGSGSTFFSTWWLGMYDTGFGVSHEITDFFCSCICSNCLLLCWASNFNVSTFESCLIPAPVHFAKSIDETDLIKALWLSIRDLWGPKGSLIATLADISCGASEMLLATWLSEKVWLSSTHTTHSTDVVTASTSAKFIVHGCVPECIGRRFNSAMSGSNFWGWEPEFSQSSLLSASWLNCIDDLPQTRAHPQFPLSWSYDPSVYLSLPSSKETPLHGSFGMSLYLCCTAALRFFRPSSVA